MIIKPGLIRNQSVSHRLERRIFNIFESGGYDGFIYDVEDISTLHQISTDIPVTAIGDAVGLILDEHRILLGDEIATNGDFSAGDVGWIKQAGWSISGGKAQVNSSIAGTTNMKTSTGLLDNEWYQIKYVIDSISGTGLRPVLGSHLLGITFSAPGEYTSYGVATGTLGGGLVASLNDTIAVVDNISIKRLRGNHSIQETAPAKPTWQVDSSGHYLLRFLGVDDSLSSTTGGGGNSGFFLCVAQKPTGGAGTLRTLFSDTTANKGYKIQIDAGNKLSMSAGDNVSFTTLASTATADIGTKNYFTAKDDGTNLSVQIGSAAEETVARPAVVAGTAGFTLFKDNGSASSFLPADFYRGVYIKNAALTPSQIATIQQWVRLGAGL